MEDKKTEEIGKHAASLSLVEIGLGSLLHSLHVPLAGQFLSINQIAFMTRISYKTKTAKSAVSLSLITSLLKSLSPAGKKLLPMLAIASQGLLYAIGPIVFGLNFIGLLIGCILSCSWAFIQPVFFIFLLFGQTSLEVYQHFIAEFSKFVPDVEHIIVWVVLTTLIIKIIVAFELSLFIKNMSDEDFLEYEKRLIKENKTKSISNAKSAWLAALSDLLSPLFLISYAFTAIFFYFSHSSSSTIIWQLLRPLAIGYILFYLVRVYPVENLSAKLEQIGLKSLGGSLKIAVEKIRSLNI
jgi:hypothetical protein